MSILLDEVNKISIVIVTIVFINKWFILQTLHPLLETGSADDETIDQYKKVIVSSTIITSKL